MDLNHLPKFAALQEARFKKIDAGKHTPLERTYAQFTKLGEEFGELAAELLGRDGHQRNKQNAAFNGETLTGELADVAITLFILAANMGVDMSEALEKKIAILNERFKDIEV